MEIRYMIKLNQLKLSIKPFYIYVLTGLVKPFPMPRTFSVFNNYRNKRQDWVWQRNVWGLEYHPNNNYRTHKILKINKRQCACSCKPTAIFLWFHLIFVSPLRVVSVQGPVMTINEQWVNPTMGQCMYIV